VTVQGILASLDQFSLQLDCEGEEAFTSRLPTFARTRASQQTQEEIKIMMYENGANSAATHDVPQFAAVASIAAGLCWLKVIISVLNKDPGRVLNVAI
jgi:hypothetical protein